MGVREFLNRRKKLVGSFWLVVILASVGFAYWQLRTAGQPIENRAFYTIDDGRTWFVDSADPDVAVTRDGKTAIRCFVYETSSQKQFVAYLQRKATPSIPGAAATGGEAFRLQVKRPGATTWISILTPEATEIVSRIVGPNGETDVIQVLP